MKAVIYHGQCPDGIMSVYLLNKVYGIDRFVPYKHGDEKAKAEIESVFFDPMIESVFFSDCCPIPEDTYGKKIVVYDHHSSEEKLLLTFEAERRGIVHFDTSRCTTKAIYEQLRSKLPICGMLERLVEAVNARDLWLYGKDPVKDRENKALSDYYYKHIDHRGIFSQETTNAIESLLNTDMSEILTCFDEAEKKKQLEINEIKNTAKYGKWLGGDIDYKIALLSTRFLRSEVSSEILNEHPELDFVVCYSMGVAPVGFYGVNGFVSHEESVYWLSLRGNGKVNLTELAKRYKDGGGHPNASGCTFSAEQFRTKIVV